MEKLLLFVILLGFILPCFSETIKLKSGKTVETKIVEKTDSYIKVDIVGIPITYYLDEIESLDGIAPSKKIEATRLSQTTALDASSSGIDIAHIHRFLKELGYPEHTWSDIERELTAFLVKIDYPRLRQEAAQVKSNPEQLKQLVSEIGRLIKQEGCLNIQSLHPLIKLLITSLGTEDIFHVIETSPISPQKNEELRQSLVACSAVSQLGSILLESLSIDAKAVFAPNHVFNCISLDDQRVLFADFLWQVFEMVDLRQYYKLEGKYQVLKEEYRISSERVREIEEQWQRGARPLILKEVFNYLYFYIYITDDYAVTPALYTNRGNVYYIQGNFPQAISDLTKAIEINPNLTEAYHNRGFAYAHQGNPSQAISDFTKAIEINPNYADAYCLRGLTYVQQGNLPQAISDCTKAIEINPKYAEAYNNRGLAYYKQDKFSQALLDYTKAIEIDPNYANAYFNRGLAYAWQQGNLPQAISDCTKAIEINPKYAEAYNNRGLAYGGQGNFPQAISDCTKAIEIDPNLAEAYYNRAGAYFYQKDFTKAWEDVRKVESLGFKVNSEFLEELKKASGREK
ncbi:MAG: tetratricopeptide repeat protein [Candidatus Omnitrophota bacterium]